MFFFCKGAEYGLRPRLLGIEHNSAALFDDAALLPGDLFEGVSQDLRVLKTDAHNQRAVRHGNGIGGVQTAAETHLQHHDVAVLRLEILKGQGRQDFEFGGLVCHGQNVRPQKNELRGQLCITDFLPVNGPTLVDPEKMRGNVESGAIAGLRQDAADHGRGRALAVGAGDMHKVQGFFGMPEPRKKRLHAGRIRTAGFPVCGKLRKGLVPGHQANTF